MGVISTGWSKKLTPFVLYALISANIDRFSNLFHFLRQENICNNTVTKDPTASQVCRYTTLWNVCVLKSTIENKMTSVTTHFKIAWSINKTDTLNIWRKNRRMQHLLYIVTETINALYPVVNFLKYVVTELVLFSAVAFKTLTFHKVV